MKRLLYAVTIMMGLAGCGGAALVPPSSPDYDPAAAQAYHPVHEGYAEYLAENQRSHQYLQLSTSTSYFLPASTENHRQIRRSAQFGRAAVEFGRILDATMQSGDIRAALGEVEKVASVDAADGLLLVLSLEEFRFDSFRAHIRLNVTVSEGGRNVLSRTYSETGPPYVGLEIRNAGYRALSHSIRASTKDAMDEIMEQMINDLALRLRR